VLLRGGGVDAAQGILASEFNPYFFKPHFFVFSGLPELVLLLEQIVVENVLRGSLSDELLEGNLAAVHLPFRGELSLRDVFRDPVVLVVSQNALAFGAFSLGDCGLLVKNKVFFSCDLHEPLLLFVEPPKHVGPDKQFLKFLRVLEFEVGLHERNLDEGLLLLEGVDHVGDLHEAVVHFALSVKPDAMLAKHVEETFGLALEFGGALGDFLNNVEVGKVLQSVVDVGPLLVLAHQFLGPLQEALLNLGEGLPHLQSCRVLYNFVQDRLVFRHAQATRFVRHRYQVFNRVAFVLLRIGRRVVFLEPGLVLGALKLGDVTNIALQFQLRLQLSHSLRPIEVGVAVLG